jgi:peptidoglycan/LPS O-acetylase OafA/YrhL
MRFRYIDFLRGICVLGILFYHICPGTPVGLGQGSMEGFFVISGFLITGTLTRRIIFGYTGLKEFMASRIRRLLPTMILYLSIVVSINVFKGKSIVLAFQSFLISVIGVYNWFQIYATTTLEGLGGIWSLSVEDQYYYVMMVIGFGVILLNIKRVNIYFVTSYTVIALISVYVRFNNAGNLDMPLRLASYATPPRLLGFAMGGLAYLISNNYKSYLSFIKGAKYISYFFIIASILLALSVKNYNPKGFIHGWLFVPILFGLGLLFWNIQKTNLLNNDKTSKLYSSESLYKAYPRTFYLLISKVGIACYPIYLFQECEKLAGLHWPWFISFLWSILIGFIVHRYFERRFYSFKST